MSYFNLQMLSCFHAGLFECQDTSTESRNLSLREFKKQIEEDNVSGEANTHQRISNKSTYTFRLTKTSS